jgi:protein-L-isoaspartate(D-aspartate) O-methyltransferase
MEASVAEAMRAIPREHFLPWSLRRAARLDQALEVSHGQTCSQPSTVADMLTLLDLHPGQRVLDVGSGTGWTTALLGHLVGPDGCVIGCEIVPELLEWGRANLDAEQLPWTRIEAAVKGDLGRPVDAPFDRILVSAMSDTLPEELVRQLGPGGILVIPVAGAMTRVVLDADGSWEATRHGFYRFVPLIR